MDKKVFLGAAGLVLGIASIGFGNGVVYADEVDDGIMPINEDVIVDETVEYDENGNIIESETGEIVPINCDPERGDDCPESGNISEEQEPTPWEKPNEELSEFVDEEIEEEGGDPVLWPMWVSFGAIGAMIIVVLVLNIAGRKYRKK